jgi:hypothetical protein
VLLPNVVGLLAIIFIKRCKVRALSNKKLFNIRQIGKIIKKYSRY